MLSISVPCTKPCTDLHFAAISDKYTYLFVLFFQLPSTPSLRLPPLFHSLIDNNQLSNLRHNGCSGRAHLRHSGQSSFWHRPSKPHSYGYWNIVLLFFGVGLRSFRSLDITSSKEGGYTFSKNAWIVLRFRISMRTSISKWSQALPPQMLEVTLIPSRHSSN